MSSSGRRPRIATSSSSSNDEASEHRGGGRGVGVSRQLGSVAVTGLVQRTKLLTVASSHLLILSFTSSIA